MGGAYHRQCQRLAGISSTWARLLARLVLIVYRDGGVAKVYGDCKHRSLTNVHRWTKLNQTRAIGRRLYILWDSSGFGHSMGEHDV